MQKTKKISRDIKALKRRTARLALCPEAKLEDAVCDIIDLGGYSAAVLLKQLYTLPESTQSAVVKKLEDFVYFHPEHGIKFVNRLITAAKQAPAQLKPSLTAMLADIAEHEENDKMLVGLKYEFIDVLKSDIDPARTTRAVEALYKTGAAEAIPLIIKLVAKHCARVDSPAEYQFIEASLLALKKLGGDAVIRLLINPASADALRQIRIEWQGKRDDILQALLKETQELDEEFAHIMLKVIDLSGINSMFAEMIKEGLSHTDKWVRQEAAAAMERAASAFNPEQVSELFADEDPAVKLMLVTSLGGFTPEQTGDTLKELALNPSEALEIRLNALYALFSQKNSEVLKNIVNAADAPSIVLNAKGLSCLLMPRSEGLEQMLRAYIDASTDLLPDASRYLLEIARPEDTERLTRAHKEAKTEAQRENLVLFLKSFLKKNSGPVLTKAIAKLSPSEQKALALLASKDGAEKQQSGRGKHSLSSAS